MKQKIFYNNIVNCARETFIRVLNLATAGDFCTSNYAALELKVKCDYFKYRKRPKKQFKMLAYVAAMIYNNEIIVNTDICYDINILLTINEKKLYKAHKFIQFVDKKLYYNFLLPGMSYNYHTRIINNLLQGVNKC